MNLKSSVAMRFSPSPLHRWKVLGVGVAANATFSAAANGIPTTAIWLRSDYRLSTLQLGLVLGSMGLGAALSELPWGMLTDRVGDRPVLLSGLLSTATTLAAMTWLLAPVATGAPALVGLVLSMCLVGVLGGSVNGASGRALLAWFADGERGLAMSIRQTAVPLGGGLGALVLPWLAKNHGFAAVYGILAASCAATAGLTWVWLHAAPRLDCNPGGDLSNDPSNDSSSQLSRAPSNCAATRRSTLPFVPQRGALRDGRIWQVVLGTGILCLPQFAVLTFATVFLHDGAHLGLSAITATMVIVQVGAMVMRIWSGRFTDRHGNRRAFLRGSTWVCGGAFIALALATRLSPNQPVLAALIGFAGICVSAWHGVAYTELATLAGTARAGTALGMANTLVYSGLFVAPLLIPHLLAAGSWTLVWLVAALCAFAAHPLFPRPLQA